MRRKLCFEPPSPWGPSYALSQHSLSRHSAPGHAAARTAVSYDLQQTQRSVLRDIVVRQDYRLLFCIAVAVAVAVQTIKCMHRSFTIGYETQECPRLGQDDTSASRPNDHDITILRDTN